MAKKRSIILIGMLCLIGFKPFSFGAEVVEDLKLPLAYLPSGCRRKRSRPRFCYPEQRASTSSGPKR